MCVCVCALCVCVCVSMCPVCECMHVSGPLSHLNVMSGLSIWSREATLGRAQEGPTKTVTVQKYTMACSMPSLLIIRLII